MPWLQPTNPLNNLTASLALALVPILLIFWALVFRKMKGYQASLLAIAAAFLIAVIAYRMPVRLALLSTANGAIYGLFPICWIIISAVFLFNCTVRSGQFEILRHFMASITADRRIQALLIAFSFGSLLEGTAGFGAPVAITAAMLEGVWRPSAESQSSAVDAERLPSPAGPKAQTTGRGFNPLYAAGLCLIANTAPVAFGSIGIPVTVAAQLTGIPEQALSMMIGRTIPFLSAILPFYLVVLMSGFRKAREIAPAALTCGLSFALIQFFSANYLGPALPDVLAGIGSIVCLLLLLRFWRPPSIWRFPEEPPATGNIPALSSRHLLWALSPFIALTVFIIVWGLPPVKDWLNAHGTVQFAIPYLHNAIRDTNGNLVPHIFKLNYASAAGTAVLLAALFALPLSGLTLRQGAGVFIATLRQLRLPILAIAAVLAFAYLDNDSGITQTIARVLANTGPLFPFFAPLLGWLGVFITGSDTSSNALFGKLQAATATSIGVDPVVTVGANASGGVIGKMISPQSIAVAAAAGNLVGKESDLFRFTVRHSFILLSIICLLVLAQAYWLKWMIPTHI